MKQGPILPCPYCGSSPEEDWVYVPENDDPNSSDEFCVLRCENTQCPVKPSTQLCFSQYDAQDEWNELAMEWIGEPNPKQKYVARRPKV